MKIYQTIQSRNRPPIQEAYDDMGYFCSLWQEQEYLDAGQYDKALMAKWRMVMHTQTQEVY